MIFLSPNWQEKCHLYTTYSPCLLGGYIICLLPPIGGEPETTIDSENGNGTPNTLRYGGDEGRPNHHLTR